MMSACLSSSGYLISDVMLSSITPKTAGYQAHRFGVHHAAESPGVIWVEITVCCVRVICGLDGFMVDHYALVLSVHTVLITHNNDDVKFLP